MKRYLPILGWLPHYDRRWLGADALAGLSVCALLVPQSLADAVGENALYESVTDAVNAGGVRSSASDDSRRDGARYPSLS